MKTIESENSVPIKAWVDGVPMEESAERQLRNVASMPFVYPHVAVLPDVHFGIGATVGSVIPTEGAIIPAAVGCDLGCGMVAQQTNLRADDILGRLPDIRSAIEAAVPHGRTDNGRANDRGAWGSAPSEIEAEWARLKTGYDAIVAKYPKLDRGATFQQLGTLGSGNHFIEVCVDTEGLVWCMLHSGSRGVGNRIGSHFIALAKEEMRRWDVHLPDIDLAYLKEGSEHFDEYVEAVGWAQGFARKSRDLMMRFTLRAIGSVVGEFELGAEAINCHHNYINREQHYGRDVWVTRKGACSARSGELSIIPGSMGAKSFIVRGKGNLESLHSCSHGAGRTMSRSAAKKTFTLADHAIATKGVECRKDASVLDETPAAYKSIEAVMAAQQDLVKVVHTLKGFVCVKG